MNRKPCWDLFVCGVFAAGFASAVPDAARRAECAAQAAAIVAPMTGPERLEQLMMDAPAVERLGVKPYHWWNEALHGIARAGLATVFPQSIGAAASFDAPLMERIGDVVSTETRAKYNIFQRKRQYGIYHGLTVWSPNVNMFRDPRWGRGQETMGEDPFLSGVMGGAYVRGLQGYDARFIKVSACAKHFAVHSGPEKLRHGFDAKVSPRDLAEYYLPAFKALVTEAKVESVMSAYNAVNGRSATANRWLLTDLLRGEWGFKGHIVSDVGAVSDVCTGHHHVSTRAEASKAALAAGLDLCSEEAYGALRDEVANGTVKPEDLATPLTHLFTTRCLLGQFDPKGTPWDHLDAADVATPEHRALARRMAEESIVLISNNGTLPLDRDKVDTLTLVGPYAMSEVPFIGNYNGMAAHFVSCASGFAAVAGPGVNVSAAPAISHINPTGGVIVACVGLTAQDEGEEMKTASGGDRATYGLPASQLAVLRGYSRNRKLCPLVAIVFGGSPVDLKPIVELCDAVLVAWYPGEEGGTALARVAFGDCNPAGRLPITYPASYDDLPPITDYALAGRTYRYATKAPAYPFGYGLSYTTFAYEGLTVTRAAKGGDLTATVRVRNTGRRAGDEVVQLYVRAPASAKDRRLHHLEAFARVRLNPGETKAVALPLSPASFQVFDEAGKPFVPKGVSEVFVGGGQPGFVPVARAEVAL